MTIERLYQSRALKTSGASGCDFALCWILGRLNSKFSLEPGPLPAVRAPSDGVTGECRVALCLFAEVCRGFGYARSQMSAGARAASVTPLPNGLLFAFSPFPPVRFSARQNQCGKDRLFFLRVGLGITLPESLPSSNCSGRGRWVCSTWRFRFW